MGIAIQILLHAKEIVLISDSPEGLKSLHLKKYFVWINEVSFDINGTFFMEECTYTIT